jgi:hypothetical protein
MYMNEQKLISKDKMVIDTTPKGMPSPSSEAVICCRKLTCNYGGLWMHKKAFQRMTSQNKQGTEEE